VVAALGEQTFLHLPLYIVEAALVELAGLALARRGPVAFGAAAVT
jgi:hypothetical protein